MTRMLVIALLTVGDPKRLTGGYLYQWRMAEAAPRHRARIGFVSFPERPFPLAMLAAPTVLRRAHRLGPDVLVLDSIAAAFVGPWLSAQPSDVPLIAMLHQPPGGMEHGSLRTALQAWLDQRAYRHACRLLVPSEALANQLAARGVPRGRIRVVPPGCDVSEASPHGAVMSDASGEPSMDDLRRGRRAAFLCVGNWLKRKGIHCLLDAFACLPNDAATLHLVGDNQADPHYAKHLRARLARPDLADRIVVHGSLPPKCVAAMYRAADVFVLPSFGEPYGMVYGEAMANGLPVVGWRDGNLPYLVEDGREGLLVPTGDLVDLSRALARLADDDMLRRWLGRAARRRASTLPTWEDTASLFFSTIREVVETSHSSCAS